MTSFSSVFDNANVFVCPIHALSDANLFLMLKISLDVILQQALVDANCAVVLKQIEVLLEERVQ